MKPTPAKPAGLASNGAPPQRDGNDGTASAFEAALDCIISITHEGIITGFNAAAERTFGHRRDEVLGKELAATIVPPAYREPHRKGLARYLATGEGPILDRRIELTALRADGTEFPIELSVTRVPTSGPPMFTAFLRDISERKQAEEALRVRHEHGHLIADISARLVLRGTDGERESADGLLTSVFAGVARHLNAEYYFNFAVGDEPDTLRLVSCAGLNGDARAALGRIRYGEHLCGIVAQTRKPVVIKDMQHCGFPNAAALCAMGATAYAGYPMVVGDRLIGTISFATSRRPCFSPEDLELIQSVANLLAAAVERDRLDRALRLRATQFATLVNEAPLGVYLVDTDLRFMHANPTAMEMFGEIPDLIGRDFEQTIHLLWPDEHADEIVAIFRRTLETGEPYASPERAECRKDLNTIEYYEWQANRITLPDGRYGVVCYFRNLAGQVLARNAITMSEARYRTLVTVITDVPWTMDTGGCFHTQQPSWTSYTGQTWEESRATGWVNALHPDDRATIQQEYADSRAARTIFQSRWRLWHNPTQSYRRVNVRATPLSGLGGEVEQWVGSCTDVENQLQADDQLRAAESKFRAIADNIPQLA
ncbi:MAG: PAS domain S-box protein [Phycisphaerales bacterium]|nr:PAS domain S-box protein [Phycisphaerales bacterium]